MFLLYEVLTQPTSRTDKKVVALITIMLVSSHLWILFHMLRLTITLAQGAYKACIDERITSTFMFSPFTCSKYYGSAVGSINDSIASLIFLQYWSVIEHCKLVVELLIALLVVQRTYMVRKSNIHYLRFKTFSLKCMISFIVK